MKTRAITKDDEYSQQLLAKKMLIVTEYQPGVTCTNFIIGQLLSENSMNCDQNIICTDLLYIESVCECQQNWSSSCGDLVQTRKFYRSTDRKIEGCNDKLTPIYMYISQKHSFVKDIKTVCLKY